MAVRKIRGIVREAKGNNEKTVENIKDVRIDGMSFKNGKDAMAYLLGENSADFKRLEERGLI